MVTRKLDIDEWRKLLMLLSAGVSLGSACHAAGVTRAAIRYLGRKVRNGECENPVVYKVFEEIDRAEMAKRDGGVNHG